MPAFDESNRRLPLAKLPQIAAWGMKAQGDGLVAGRDDAAPDRVCASPSQSERSMPSSSARKSLARITSAPVSTKPSSSGVEESGAERETGTNGRNTG